MPWVKLDENFPDHRKLAELGDLAPLAGWLFICGLAFCNRQLTDGRIPKATVRRLTSFYGLTVNGNAVDAQALAEVLEAVNMWEDHDTHYLVHDYLVYQPSREAIEADRRQKIEAGRLGGAASAQARAQASAQAGAKAAAQAGAVAGAQAESKPVPVPDPLKDQIQDRAHARESEPRTATPTEQRRISHDRAVMAVKPWRLRCQQRGHDPACQTPKECELLAQREES